MKNCEDTTLDVERSSFERLSIKDRLALRMHLAMCPQCRKYFKDSTTIDTLLKKRFSHLGEEYKFTQEEKDEMKRKLAG